MASLNCELLLLNFSHKSTKLFLEPKINQSPVAVITPSVLKMKEDTVGILDGAGERETLFYTVHFRRFTNILVDYNFMLYLML